MKSPTKVIENFKNFKAASAAAMDRVALSGTPVQKLKAVGPSPVQIRMSPVVSPAVRSAQILSGLKKANRVQAVAILLTLQAQSMLQPALTVLGDLMRNFTESLAKDRDERRQKLVDAEKQEKERVEQVQANARASRSEEVPLIANQSEAEFRHEANFMVRACNSESGTVELCAGWLRPAVLGDASDASGNVILRLYGSKSFLKHYDIN